MCVEGFHTDRFLLLRTPFCIEILHIGKVKILIATDRSVSPHLAK